MGKYESFTAAAGVAAEGTAEPRVIRAEGDTVTIPDAHLLFSGDFSRSGADLVIAGEGQSVVVADYFGDAGSPALAAPNGAVLLPDVVSALAGPLAPGQYAQADDGEPAQGIGSVVSLTGSATAQRSDGTVVDLTVDSRLAEGDVVQTASGSALSIVFDDGAVFNLNADSRMVLNELVYEPGGDSNSMLFSMVQGVFAFVAGQVAPTGEMRIDTPAASMGIRGTSGIVKLETIDGVAVFRVVPDPVTNNVGTIVLYVPGTDIILVVMESSDSQWAVDPATGQVIEQPVDPGDAELIEQLHQTYIEFAGIVDDPGEVQFAEAGGSGLPTQFSPTPAEFAAIVALAGGAFPQEEESADEPAGSGVDPEGQGESAIDSPLPANEPGSSDPQQPPQPGFTGDDFGSVDEDGTSSTTGQLVFAGGTGLIEPLVIEGTYGTFEIDADGNWVYTLDNDSDAVQSLGEGVRADETFAVVSADGSETQFVTITVQGVNDVPTVTGATTEAVVEDGTQVATGTITVADPDAGESSVQPQNNVAGTYGTFSILANGNWTYTLDNADPAVQALAEGDTVTDIFTVTSFDGTANETVTVTVTGTNDVPTVAGTTTGAVVEDGMQVATGTITVADPDAGESSVQPQTNVAGTYGTFSILANGNWTYTLDNADPAVQALAEGDTVTDIFTVTSFDGTANETVTVTVTGTNDVPTVTGTTTGAALEDGQVATGTITVADPDAGESSVQPQTNVAGTYGTFSILANGDWTYTLDNADPAVQALAEGDTVTDIFTVTSFDGTANETVTVTVTGANDAPVAQNDALATNENAAVNGNVLADNGNGPDDDVDGDPLTVTHVNGSTANVGTQIVLASGALLLLNADGSFAYDPNGQFDELGPGDSAQDSFTYTLADGQGGSDTATVTLTINGVNDAPVAAGSLIATNEGVSASGMLTGMDVDSDTLNFSLEQGPQNGTVVINADGSYVYTPDGGVTGQDSFTFRVTDGQGAFDTATVAIDIAGVGELAAPKDIVGTSGNDVLIGSALDDILRGGAGDDVLLGGGAPQDFTVWDQLFGGPGDDLLVAEGGAVLLMGGAGNDVLTSTDAGTYYDWVRADYRSSPAGILANLTAATIGGLAAGEVADGFGTVDQVSNIHVLADSAHNDVIHVDSSYTNSIGNFIEVRLSGGDDQVFFNGVSNARISYQQALGPVLLDLEAGTGTDLVPGDNFIGDDTFEGATNARGSSFGDEIYGRLQADDVLRGSGGDDLIDGRGGINTIAFNDSEFGIHVDLSQNLVLDDGIFIGALGRNGIDTLLNIQNVRGSDWDDLIVGDAGNNRLFGGLGNDVLRSGGAPQNFFGEDRLFGGEGDDTLTAEGGWVMLEGGAGNDVLTSTDTGGFWDFVRADYQSSPAGIVVNLTIGPLGNLAPGEVADGFGTVDQVSNMHLIADSPHDDVIHVDDSYTNSFGNWIEVRLSGGNDTVLFSGVSGARISYAQALGPVLLDLDAATGTDRFAGDNFIGNDTFQGANSARGSRFDDEIYGRVEFNDSLRGSGGDDYIDGRGGTNTITFGDSSFGIHVDLSQNLVLDDGVPHHTENRNGIDEVHNIQNVSGTTWSDVIIGDGGNNELRSGGAPQDFFAVDRLNGRGGDDILTAQGGGAILVGGAGNDVLESFDEGGHYDWVRADYGTSPNGIVANLTEGFINDLAPGQVADGFGTTDFLWRMHVLADSPHNDVIHVDGSYTNSFGNWIEVRLSGGNDTVNFNGVANARISYAQALGPVIIDLETSTGTDRFAGGNIGTDTFQGANSARGSRFDDEIYGRVEFNDSLRGSGGDDYIDGRGGTNTITFGDSSFGVHVDLSQNVVLDDGIAHQSENRNGIDEVHNVQNVSGSEWDDLIIGDGGNNVLSGGRGDDELRSGGAPQEFAGFDVVNGELGNDTLIAEGGFVMLRGGAGNDVLTSTDAGGHWDFVLADYRGSPGAIVANLTGGTINGLASGEVADGFGTVDHVSNVHVIVDSPHNDVIYVDATYTNSAGSWIEVRLSGGDDFVTFAGPDFARISYSYAQGAALIDLEAGTATDLNDGDNFIGSDTFGGATAARGSRFDDVILGREAGNDDLRGNAGNDFIDGRGGINTISFAGAEFGIHVDLSQNPQNRVLNDGHINNATESPGVDEVHNVHNVNGSEWDDQIIGDAGDNVLRGGIGDDALAGGGGNDTLVGGPGADSMNGGAGTDRFGFRAPDDGVDSIIDFGVSEDVLVIDASVFGGGLVAGAGLSPDQFVSGNGPQPTEAHGQFLYDTVLGELSWDVDGTGGQEAVHFATLAGAPALTESIFELIGAGGSFVGSSQVAAAVDGGGEPVA